jgi:hypothetical protein
VIFVIINYVLPGIAALKEGTDLKLVQYQTNIDETVQRLGALEYNDRYQKLRSRSSS